jgi:hypothetical protein
MMCGTSYLRYYASTGQDFIINHAGRLLTYLTNTQEKQEVIAEMDKMPSQTYPPSISQLESLMGSYLEALKLDLNEIFLWKSMLRLNHNPHYNTDVM